MATFRPRYVGPGRSVTGNFIPAGADRPADGPLALLLTAIPTEVIAVYLAVSSPFGEARANWFWWSVVGGTVATFLYVALATQDFGKTNAKVKAEIAWRQSILACWAFVFWAIGTVTPELGQKIAPAWWYAAFAPVAIAIGTFTLPILDGLLARFGLPQNP